MALQNISEAVQVGDFLGANVEIRDYLNQRIGVTRVAFRAGMRDLEFAVVQAYELDQGGEILWDQPFWFTCGAANVVEALHKAADSLPLAITVGETVSAKGRKVLTIK